MHVSRHDHFSLYVTNLEQSEKWYREILGLEPVHADIWGGKTSRFLGHGEAMIALFLKPPEETFSSKGMPIGNHHAFRVDREAFEGFKQHLAAHGISFRQMDHQISESIYFQDPDDYWMEITTYC